VICRSRESGNPEKSRRWIPANAGMTGFSSFPKWLSCHFSMQAVCAAQPQAFKYRYLGLMLCFLPHHKKPGHAGFYVFSGQTCRLLRLSDYFFAVDTFFIEAT
jgi:hypothetical protein